MLSTTSLRELSEVDATVSVKLAPCGMLSGEFGSSVTKWTPHSTPCGAPLASSLHRFSRASTASAIAGTGSPRAAMGTDAACDIASTAALSSPDRTETCMTVVPATAVTMPTGLPMRSSLSYCSMCASTYPSTSSALIAESAKDRNSPRGSASSRACATVFPRESTALSRPSDS